MFICKNKSFLILGNCIDLYSKTFIIFVKTVIQSSRKISQITFKVQCNFILSTTRKQINKRVI